MPAAALQSALAIAYNLDELRLLAATGLGAEPESIWGDGATVDAAALALVEWAQRRGKLCALATAAAQERPGNEALQMIARLMPLWCESEGRREWDAPPVIVERQEPVTDPGGEYSNGVQRTLGRVETQVDALREDVAVLRRELQAQREDAARRYAGQRAQLWLLVVAVAGMLGTAGALALHAWGA